MSPDHIVAPLAGRFRPAWRPPALPRQGRSDLPGLYMGSRRAFAAGIASEAKQSRATAAVLRSPGLLRRYAPRTDGGTCGGASIVLSDRLVVGADFRILAQDAVDRVEHVAHPRFRDRAFDDHHQLRLVGGRAHEAPRPVLDRHPDAVD